MDGPAPDNQTIESVEEDLDSGLSLEQMAEVARLCAYHFARQFKRPTGLPPAAGMSPAGWLRSPSGNAPFARDGGSLGYRSDGARAGLGQRIPSFPLSPPASLLALPLGCSSTPGTAAGPNRLPDL